MNKSLILFLIPVGYIYISIILLQANPLKWTWTAQLMLLLITLMCVIFLKDELREE
ncbi:hypothetical protein [Christiangramia forsetii]|uniref:Membrane protein n=1 Tax=Christiangramia forsetii (strain DSM 17595 / CGMCC 1.15422 / KT0803) TaxID=411154 RepID=A0M476_CHRFK|nr:hypothetical protein [Christiangramia forsetii]CAL67421.1 membrane protein [Christiangramia forsetii KT0803]